LLSKKKQPNPWPEPELLENVCSTLFGRLQGKGYRPVFSSLTKDKIAKEMRKISEDQLSWSNPDTYKENLQDLEFWAETQLNEEGQIRKQKNTTDGPTLKYPNALTWVTAYDEDIKRIAEQLRECLFGQKAAPFDWQKFKSKNVEQARSKAIQWVKDTVKEETGRKLTFEREKWTELGCDAAWFDGFRRGAIFATVFECDYALLSDGLETFTKINRLNGVVVSLYDPKGQEYPVKVPHGGKLAWFVKWSGYLARRSGWWSDSDAMNFVLTNMPAMIASPVTGSFKSPEHGVTLQVPGTSDCSFVPEKIVLTIHSPASVEEVTAAYRRVMKFHRLKRHKLSVTGEALLELYFQMPDATWLERLERWEVWCSRNPNLTPFQGANASKALREEWKRATECASWRPMQRKVSTKLSETSLPIIHEPPED
jgi:hypothetical protein